jgi:hypothetical protein
MTPEQLLTAEYYDFVDSPTINRRFKNVRPVGIYDGGYIAQESATSIRVKTMTAEISSIYLSTVHQIQVEITADALVTSLVSTQKYVVLRWQYTPVSGSNDVTIEVVALGDIQTYDVIIGILSWSGASISGISYYDSVNDVRRTTPETPEQLLKVVPHPSGGRNVVVKYGRAMIGGTLYTISDTEVVCSASAGFIYLSSAGTPIFEAGTSYTNKLLLALVNDDGVIVKSSITDKRGFLTAPSSAANYNYATSVTAFTITKDASTGPDGQGSFYDIPGMSISITTTGNPVLIMFNASLGFSSGNNDNYVRLLVDTTLVAKKVITSGDNEHQGEASMMAVAVVSAGAHTIKAQVWPKDCDVKNIGQSDDDYQNRRNIAVVEL